MNVVTVSDMTVLWTAGLGGAAAPMEGGGIGGITVSSLGAGAGRGEGVGECSGETEGVGGLVGVGETDGLKDWGDGMGDGGGEAVWEGDGVRIGDCDMDLDLDGDCDWLSRTDLLGSGGGKTWRRIRMGGSKCLSGGLRRWGRRWCESNTW